jgi:hypothetical protein
VQAHPAQVPLACQLALPLLPFPPPFLPLPCYCSLPAGTLLPFPLPVAARYRSLLPLPPFRSLLPLPIANFTTGGLNGAVQEARTTRAA